MPSNCTYFSEPVATMTYALSLTSLAFNYTNPRAILISGVQPISQSACFRFEIYLSNLVSFIVRVPKCIYTSDSYGSLLTVTAGLGDAWHKVWLPISVSSVCNAQFQFEVVYDSSFGLNLAASIANVALLDGGCVTGQLVCISRV